MGWSPLTLALEDGRRWSAADAHLTERPDNLAVRAEAAVDRIKGSAVILATGERIEAVRIVLAAGAFGSPALLVRSGLTRTDRVAEALNHDSIAIVVDLDPELQIVGAPGAPTRACCARSPA